MTNASANANKQVNDNDPNRKRVAYIFFNAAAGSANNQIEDTILDMLEPQFNVKLIHLNLKDPERHCRKILKALPSSSPSSSDIPPIVVAVGGDGTVAAVAKAVIASTKDTNTASIPLGVIPMGTANAFAAALGIPTDIEAACDVLRKGNTRRIDAAECKPGKTMTLLAGLGFEANMVKVAQGRFKKWFGRLAYIWGGTKQVLAPETFSCRVSIFLDEKTQPLELDLDTNAITVAVVAPSGSISAQGTGNVIEDDGLLDITIQTSSTMLERLDAIIHLLGSALVQRPTETENIFRCRARRVEIKTKTRQRVVVDGELFRRRKSFEFGVLPNALEVVVPPPPPPAKEKEAATPEDYIDLE